MKIAHKITPRQAARVQSPEGKIRLTTLHAYVYEVLSGGWEGSHALSIIVTLPQCGQLLTLPPPSSACGSAASQTVSQIHFLLSAFSGVSSRQQEASDAARYLLLIYNLELFMNIFVLVSP